MVLKISKLLNGFELENTNKYNNVNNVMLIKLTLENKYIKIEIQEHATRYHVITQG